MLNNAKAKFQNLFFKPVAPVKYTVTLPDPVISKPRNTHKKQRSSKLSRWIHNHCGGGIS